MKIRYSFRSMSLAALGAVAAMGAASMLGGVSSAESASPAFQQNLRGVESQMTAVERSFGTIAMAKTDAQKDALAAEFEAQQKAYAENLRAQYNAAIAEAKVSVTALKAFEDLAQSHEARWKVLHGKAQAMRPAGAVSLQPWTSSVASTEPSWSFMDLIIPQARAAIALKVYLACKQPRNNAVCAAALVSAAQESAAAYATFNTCWASYASKKPAAWRAFLRVGCTSALVARLA